MARVNLGTNYCECSVSVCVSIYKEWKELKNVQTPARAKPKTPLEIIDRQIFNPPCRNYRRFRKDRKLFNLLCRI